MTSTSNDPMVEVLRQLAELGSQMEMINSRLSNIEQGTGRLDRAIKELRRARKQHSMYEELHSQLQALVFRGGGNSFIPQSPVLVAPGRGLSESREDYIPRPLYGR